MASDTSDTVLWEGRPSQLTALRFYFLTAVVAVILVVASVYAYSADMTGVWQYPLFGVLLAALVALVKYFVVRSTKFTITDERIRVVEGLLSQKTEEIELYRVRDFNVVQPFWLRPAGQGHVRVLSNDASAPELLINGVSKPHEVHDLLRKNVETARDKKRVRHLDVE